ncbi:hypothetical protein COCNU_02G014130 [Cocos nucifera]|uniref:DEK C-terminal domain-containing protein n=1 Tax=Cocos nucifera TaxID=13894 RepID=A0A8K0MX27_COCNU|nr:hypothetical protein COCNU_02G014130 [Cocos nucifera]
MAGAKGRRKRKRGGKAEASGSGNARNVGQKSGKRKATSVSWEEEVPAFRSVRERKAVDRFVPGPQPNEKVREPKVFSIKQGLTEASFGLQGPGTKLQDIPNGNDYCLIVKDHINSFLFFMVFKLSERKANENLEVLHTILYGRKSKGTCFQVYFWKKNILQFSGFVWAENEEKERAKVKERIDKCNKERLLLLCELLDIPDMKATTKKEEVSAKLLEFLESPHVTRSVVRAENVERGRKQKNIEESGQQAYGKGKAKVSRKPPPEPTEEEMRTVVIDWAQEIGFAKTIQDKLFPQLKAHFKMDLWHRKEELRHILADLVFEEDNQDGDADDSGGEDAASSGEDTRQKDSEGSDEDSGEEEDAEGSDEDDEE